MNTETIHEKIQTSAADLRAAGIGALYLFGSQARGDARANSDVDIAFDVSVEADARFSLIDQARIQLNLQKLLEANVDLVSRAGMRPKMRARVEAEMVRIL